MGILANSKFLERSSSALKRYCSLIPLENAQNNVNTLLNPILDFQEILHSKDKQVTFFGAFKTGKSTLLNAIIGNALLPSRVNRATGVVTKIGYGPQQSARVILRQTDGVFLEKPIFFDDLDQYILLDISSGTSKAPEGIEEVLIRISHPLMRYNWLFVDTPGLMDNPELSERSFQEVKKSDLVVMVLAADKLLSEDERETAKRIHNLLNGNIVFMVNRLGLVDEEERKEVLDWAQTALIGLGNSLVGQPSIFATDAKASLAAKMDGITHPAELKGLQEFEWWLERMWSTQTGEKLAALARLGILESHLSNAQLYFHNQLTKAQTTIKDLTQAEAKAFAAREAKLKRRIDSDRIRLSSYKVQLYQLGESFVKNCRENAKSLMDKDPQWREKLKSYLDSAYLSYAESVYRGVTSPALQTGVTVPVFELHQSSVNTDVTAAGDVSLKLGVLVGAAIGSFIGPEGTVAGAALGAWLGKTLFGVNVKQKTLESLEQAARGMLPTITAQAEQYIDSVDQLLVDFGKSHSLNPQPSSSLQAAQQTEQYYSSLVSWCQEFQSTIKNLKKEIVG